MQPTMSALPVMQPIMQLAQPGFVAIMFCVAADFAASSVVLLNAVIVATSHPPPPPVTALPPPPPGALQLSEAQQTTFMYMTPPACICAHVWRVLTVYVVFTAPDACSDGVHAVSSFEQGNEYETQTASSSPGGMGIGIGAMFGPMV